MKVESLVIVDQHATVNLYLGLVLPARHALEVEWIRSLIVSFSIFPYCTHLWCAVYYPAMGGREKKRESIVRGQSDQELFGNWSEVVTR